MKKTNGFDERGYPVNIIIGYAATREEGLQLLANYNHNPWDVDLVKSTLEQLFELWKEQKAPELSRASRSALCSTYNHCKALASIPYKQIKAFEMQATIDNCGKSYSTQAAIKALWGHLDRFALELDIISKCYSELLTSAPVPSTSKTPFTDDEVNTIWKHQNEPWVDFVPYFFIPGGESANY